MSIEYAQSQIAMDLEIKKALSTKLKGLEDKFEADVIFYFGNIHNGKVPLYRELIENLKNIDNVHDHNKLVIFLNTPGGSVETVEQFVNINRYFYEKVYFVVPDYAMSAGTVFCLSGDKIFMDYSSALGPIDPQVYSDKQKMFIPALGYLDKMEEFVEKSRNGTLTEAEFLLLRDVDMAFLKQCEQQKNLTIELIKEWLIKYKFKDWEVDENDKIQRAEEIAEKFGNNKLWCSHGRCIDVVALKNEIKLKIDDYSNDLELKELIRSYNELVISYIRRLNYISFLHSRNNF